MKNLFTRSFSRSLLKGLAVSALAVFCLYWYTLNLWVERKVPFIESTLSGCLHRPVTLQSAHFDPFRGFLIYGVELKQYPPRFSPVHIRRVKVVPDFQFYPALAIRVRKLVIDGPVMTLSLRPETVFRAGMILRNLSPEYGNIGAIKILVDPSSFEMRGAKVVLEPPKNGQDWRQEYENVDFLARRGMFGNSTVKLKGNIAGRKEASFLIRCDTNRETAKGLHSNMRLDLNHFKAAYLNRHLDGRLRLPDIDSLTASVYLKIRDGSRFQARGRITSPNVPFSMNGSWNKKGIEFDKITVKGGPVELRGGGLIRWAGAAGFCHFQLASDNIPAEKFKDTFHPVIPDAGQVRFVAGLKGDTRNLEPSLQVALSNCGLHDPSEKIQITHLNGLVSVSKNGLELREVWAFVNDLPLRVDGRWQSREKDRFSFEASTYPGQLPELHPLNRVNVSLKAAGARLKSGWVGTVRLTEEKFDSGEPRKETWAMTFHGLSMSLGRWSCRSLELIRRSSDGVGEAMAIVLRRFDLMFSVDREGAQAEIRDTSLAAGQAKLRARIRFAGPTYQISATVAGLHVSRFLDYLKKDYPISGKISAYIHSAGTLEDPRTHLRFQITDGSVGSNGSLKYWVEQTGIDALRGMRFSSFSGDAHYGQGAWLLRNFSLIGDQARLAAQLKVAGQKISGLLTVKFLTSSIRESSDLKWLVRFVGGDDWVDFDFRIAGYLASPRVQWLGGEFKKRVQSHLAPWMKNELTRQVEKRMTESPSRPPA